MTGASWVVLLLAIVVLSLSGCAGDSGGSATLSYSGSDNGTHSDSTKCNSDGTVTSSGKVDNGSVHVTVTDGSGNQIFTQSFGTSVDASAQAIHGASGTWKLEATRSGGGILSSPFSGNYNFHLAC